MYKIEESEREFLKLPFGELCTNPINKVKGTKLIAVGDYSVLYFLRNGIKPSLAIVDFKTRRAPLSKEERTEIENSYKIKIFFRNRRGFVEENSIKLAVLKDKLEKVLVVVEGEEDLVALPLILNLSENESIVYGLFDKAVVVRKDSKSLDLVKERFSKILNQILKFSNSFRFSSLPSVNEK